jgi:20S proteasome subunit alpha 6
MVRLHSTLAISVEAQLFFAASLDELITHGLHALRETLQQDKELTIMNTSIGIVGPPAASEQVVKAKGAFRILEGEPIASFLATMTPKETTVAPPEPDSDDDEAPAAGDGDVQMSDA